MLTGADLVAPIPAWRCTYPTAAGMVCGVEAAWVGRCTTCGFDGGDERRVVCGEHRFELSGVLDYAADQANIRCMVCSKPLRVMWEQL